MSERIKKMEKVLISFLVCVLVLGSLPIAPTAAQPMTEDVEAYADVDWGSYEDIESDLVDLGDLGDIDDDEGYGDLEDADLEEEYTAYEDESPELDVPAEEPEVELDVEEPEEIELEAGQLAFDLHANVFDRGEAVDGILITLDSGTWNLAALTADTFDIYAMHVLPYDVLGFGQTDEPVARTVTGFDVSADGRTLHIHLEVDIAAFPAGQPTISWAPTVEGGRGLLMDLDYTVVLPEDVALAGDDVLLAETEFVQTSTVIRPEADLFGASSHGGMNYRYFRPSVDGDRPLVVYFHGIGDGGSAINQNNSTTILGTRGATSLVSAEAQSIFGGAHVLVPQAPNNWMGGNTVGHVATATSMINAYVANNNVDASRIYIVGPSAGGYMVLRMALANPDMFAAVVPLCPVLFGASVTDEALAGVTTPMWVINSLTCEAHAPMAARVAEHVPGVIHTPFTNIYIPELGGELSGHYAWVLFGRNMPVYNGQSVWSWMAQQALAPAAALTFDLHATVYDAGEAVDRISLTLEEGAWDLDELDLESFEILATHTSPHELPAGSMGFGQATDAERIVTGFEVSEDGSTLYIDLAVNQAAFGAGEGTLSWTTGAISRNLIMDLDYVIELLEPIALADGTVLDVETVFTQSENIFRAEVDLFGANVHNGMPYRYFTPDADGDLPLMIWFHGIGEGGSVLGADNYVQLLGNRGGTAFVSDEAQEIFGGLHVIAPQAPNDWMGANTAGHIETFMSLLHEYIANNNVDTSRIYVTGGSAGGFMTLHTVIANPGFFAAAFPVCPVISAQDTPREMLEALRIPMWVINAEACEAHAPMSLRVRDEVPGAIHTPFETVTVDGMTFNGHWSWILMARNIPTYNGETVWEWAARQSLPLAEPDYLFDIHAHVFDAGEAVHRISITLEDGAWDVDALSADAFEIYATHFLPADTNQTAVLREITGFEVDGSTLYIDLAVNQAAFGPGEGTLRFLMPGFRNVVLNLDYEINLLADITLVDGIIEAGSIFGQSADVIRAEVDLFNTSTHNGINYRYFTPDATGDRPLIIWLHGMGEGGMPGNQNNITQLLGNRGGTAFVTDEAQEIFGGIHVLAPQSQSMWSAGQVNDLMSVITHYVETHHVDTSRIYITGGSAGAYMSLRMVIANPNFFAAIIPVCPAMMNATNMPDEQLLSIAHVPMWVVHSYACTSDTPNALRLDALLEDSIRTGFETVTVDGMTFNGHWSWILMARNIPEHNGLSIWEWIAEQSLPIVEPDYIFDVHAHVFDAGEAVHRISITLEEGAWDVDALDLETFEIYATHFLPTDATRTAARREVIGFEVDGLTLYIDLAVNQESFGPGEGTLRFLFPGFRNIVLDLDYEINLLEDIDLGDDLVMAAGSIFGQSTDVIRAEVDQFGEASYGGINYRYFAPEVPGNPDRPLVIWLHGMGEGGLPTNQNNIVQLLGNRGGTAFVTEEAQTIFGGAHVIAPQAPSGWGPAQVQPLMDLILDYAANHNVDMNRISIYGASAGGGQVMRMLIQFPDFFAAAVPICPAINPVAFPDEAILSLAHIPMWLINAENDTTTPPATTSSRIHALLPHSIYTLYPNVIVDGMEFNGHWNWIYVARNMPRHTDGVSAWDQTDGETIWEWTARQTLADEVGAFDMIANVYDGGEAVDRVSLTLAEGAWDVSALTPEMFDVRATHTLSYDLPAGAMGFGQVHNQARIINAFEVSEDGSTLHIDLVVLDLTGPLVGFLPGANTLSWVQGGGVGRNLVMDLDYTIRLNADIPLVDGSLDGQRSDFVQNELIRPEFDLFEAGHYAGLNYQYFVPENSNARDEGRPLFVWFHGAGEGGTAISQNNMTQLLANRSATAFVTDEAQEIFGGAYVLAPQATSGWGGDAIIDDAMALIENFAANHNVDMNRIYISGGSAGGSMTIRTVIANPDFFAAMIPVCPVISVAGTPDHELLSIAHVPMWLIYSHACEAHAPISQRIHSLLPDIVYTPFETVYVPGTGTFNGHWSWVLLGQNIPTYNNETVWEWIARQTLPAEEAVVVGEFDLHAHVYDAGEAINRVILTLEEGAWDLESLTPEMFDILATHSLSYDLPEGSMAFGQVEDAERVITGFEVDGATLYIDLAVNQESFGAGEGTLAWTMAPGASRNLVLDLDYAITVTADIPLAEGTLESGVVFTQTDVIIRPEVDQFGFNTYAGLNYRYFVPADSTNQPLIVWLHGGGEGGIVGLSQNNMSQLLANRGALGFMTDEAQDIFGGAYVLAPQAQSSWGVDVDITIEAVMDLIVEFAANNNVDMNRIYLSGPSAGGAMTLRTAIAHPDFFAALVPVCPAGVTVENMPDAQLLAIAHVPMWLIHSYDCERDTPISIRINELLTDSIRTGFETVTVDGMTFNGHWSWIFLARNIPTYNSETVWEWMARQTLAVEIEVPTQPTEPDCPDPDCPEVECPTDPSTPAPTVPSMPSRPTLPDTGAVVAGLGVGGALLLGGAIAAAMKKKSDDKNV